MKQLPKGLFRREGSPFIWIKYSHRGRSFRESTRTADIVRAIEIREKRKEEALNIAIPSDGVLCRRFGELGVFIPLPGLDKQKKGAQ